MSLTNDIEKIKLQQEKLKARYEQLLCKENAANRKRRDRQCYIIGAWIISNQPELAGAIPKELTRDQDRKAFGLEPLTSPNSDLSPFSNVDIALPLAGKPTVGRGAAD